MPNTILGKATIVPKGPYSAITEYWRLCMVTAGGESYLYVGDTPSTGTPLTDPRWQKIAEKGEQGNQDIVDAAIAAKNAAQASAAQLAAGVASPAGTYATAAALTTANPDHGKIYVVTADGKWYYWNGTAWAAGGVYQATSTTASNVQTNVAGVTAQEMLDSLSFSRVGGRVPLISGSYYRGVIQTNATRVVTQHPVFIRKGEVVKAGFIFLLDKVSDDLTWEAQVAVWQKVHTVAADGLYYLTFHTDMTMTVDILAGLNASYDSVYRISSRSHANYDTLNMVNTANVLNADIVSDLTASLMAHVSCAVYDTFLDDGTLWVTYYQDATTTNEGAQATVEICLCAYNIYSKAKVYHKILSGNETVGGFTQGNSGPYDPIIVVRQYDIVLLFRGHTTLSCIAVMTISKADFTMSNGQVASLTYNGTPYPMDITNMRTVFEAASGLTLTKTLTNLSINNLAIHDGMYYAVVNETFSLAGWKPMVIRSTDLYNWELYDIITGYNYQDCESEIQIANGVMYAVFRAAANTLNIFLVYDIATKAILHQAPVLHSIGIKPSIRFLGSRLIAVMNVYDDVSTNFTGGALANRKNAGIFEISTTDYSFKLLSYIYTVYGCHYQSLCLHKRELLMTFSEDRRMINDTLIRQNIAFCRLLLD